MLRLKVAQFCFLIFVHCAIHCIALNLNNVEAKGTFGNLSRPSFHSGRANCLFRLLYIWIQPDSILICIGLQAFKLYLLLIRFTLKCQYDVMHKLYLQWNVCNIAKTLIYVQCCNTASNHQGQPLNGGSTQLSAGERASENTNGA